MLCADYENEPMLACNFYIVAIRKKTTYTIDLADEEGTVAVWRYYNRCK